MRRLLVAAAALALLLVACGETKTADQACPTGPEGRNPDLTFAAFPHTVIDQNKTYTALMKTNLGDLTFELLPKEAPLAVNNFVFLAREGFFDCVIFHRVIPGFMAQSGDPTGTGGGGTDYAFEIEAPQRPYVRGSLAMANRAAPNTNRSQFFIVLADLTAQGRLTPDYTLFGAMTAGEDTLAKIEALPVGPNEAGEESVPLEEIRISTIEITDR
jgi:cyclophilin family peptidyl-prolyl cis-trans isomerase